MAIIGPLLLGALIVCGGGAYVTHVAREVGAVVPSRVRTEALARTARVRSGAVRVRSGAAGVRQRMPKIDPVRTEWAKVTATDWLEERRAKRAAPRRTLRARILGATGPAFDPSPQQAPQASSPLPAGVTSIAPRRPDFTTAPKPRPAAPRLAPVPSEVRPVTTPAPPSHSSGSGAGADLFTAIGVIIGHANGGGVQAKLRALHQLTEGIDMLGGALDGFSRRLAEPDQMYPSVVWEPVATAGAHSKAAAMAAAEAETALRSLLNRPLGEAAGQVPHHREVNAPA